MNLNLFDIDYMDKMSALLKESFKFKKYKAMPPALAVFTGLFMLPFVIWSFFVTAALAIECFTFAIIVAPIKFLHNLVNNEGKDVKHATQAIIYIISWPLIFANYAMIAFNLFIILPTYALLSIINYIWTLGGFKFHVFINKSDDIAIDVEGKYFGRPLTFVIVNAVIVFIELITLIVGLADPAGMIIALIVCGTFAFLQFIFCGLFSLIAFSLKGKETAAPAPAVEQPAFVAPQQDTQI